MEICRQMYGQSHVSPMPDYSDYELWDQYMGQLWLGLMAGVGIKPDATIMEVAPGATAKIPHALSQLNFHGKLYLVEPHRKCGELIYDKAASLLKNAEVIWIPQGFDTVRIDGKIDAIVANHPFDDFISAYATVDETKRAILFQDISQEAAEVLAILKETWHGLVENPGTLSSVKRRVKDNWQAFIQYHHPGTVILSQYASSYFDKHGLSLINTHAKDVFDMVCNDCPHAISRQEIQEILNRNENYRNSWIGLELLNAANWVIDDARHVK